MSLAREVKSDKPTKQVSGTAKRAALATQPWPRRSEVHRRGSWGMVLPKDKVEIGDSPE
jgi:hypothetical protein